MWQRVGHNNGSAGHGRRVVIIGAGPGGLCMGIKLKEAGYTNFTILEKGSGVGGTWYHNSYPGAACDIQSALYSYSFEMKVDWSRPYGTQPKIRAYLEAVADKYGMLPYIRWWRTWWSVPLGCSMN